MKKKDNIKIRIATLEDAKRLLDIYTPYIEKTAITFEYSIPSIEEFKSRISNTLNKYPYLVAEKDNKILGYAYASPFKERAAYDWAVETTIYVDKDMRKMGIGKILYDSLEKVLLAQNILNLNACIAYPIIEDEYLTKNSVNFHKHLGYRLVGEFYQCGYKFNRWYNMVWMEKHIGSHIKNQPPIKTFEEVREFIKNEYKII